MIRGTVGSCLLFDFLEGSHSLLEISCIFLSASCTIPFQMRFLFVVCVQVQHSPYKDKSYSIFFGLMLANKNMGSHQYRFFDTEKKGLEMVIADIKSQCD